jgi:hypothetical protein
MSTEEDARSNELTKKTNKKSSNEPQPFNKQDPTEPVQVKKEKAEASSSSSSQQESSEEAPAGVQ